MRYVILIMLMVFSRISYSQDISFDGIAGETVFMKYNNGSSASGVMVGDSNYFYLVTARHCIIKEFSNGNPVFVGDSLNLIYYNGDQYSVKADTLKISVADGYGRGDILIDTLHDIGIISIAKVVGKTQSGKNLMLYNEFVVKTTLQAPNVIASEFFVKFDGVKVTDESFIFGYPSSLQLSNQSDFEFDRPLIRAGVIAGKSKKFGTIIVDCPVYQGNSGGPVYVLPRRPSSSKGGIIGIVSRSVLHEERLENTYYQAVVSINYSNSGYSVIVPIEYAGNLMKSYLVNHPK